MRGWSHGQLLLAMRSKGLETFKAEGLGSGGCIAMGLSLDHPFLQDPRTSIVEGCEGVFKTAFPTAQFATGWIGILACISVAQIARSGVGDCSGEDGDYCSMDVAMNHGHHIVFDAVTVSFPFAAHNHFSADVVCLASGERVAAVGLFKASADAMNGDFPEL